MFFFTVVGTLYVDLTIFLFQLILFYYKSFASASVLLCFFLVICSLAILSILVLKNLFVCVCVCGL